MMELFGDIRALFPYVRKIVLSPIMEIGRNRYERKITIEVDSGWSLKLILRADIREHLEIVEA